jgi:hypothetical protein
MPRWTGTWSGDHERVVAEPARGVVSPCPLDPGNVDRAPGTAEAAGAAGSVRRPTSPGIRLADDGFRGVVGRDPRARSSGVRSIGPRCRAMALRLDDVGGVTAVVSR